jgi:nicotinate-nucleotide adenylyltransferase
MTSSTAPCLLFGGTFDPVHLAHIAMARAALSCSGAARLILLPAGDPPHRQLPGVSAADRAKMLALACVGDARLQIDDRELHREGPSYSVLTLREYREERGPDTPLVMVLGADAAAGLGGWQDAAELAGLAHLLVLARPGTELDPQGPGALGWRQVDDFSHCRESAGGLWLQHVGPLMPHSATAVRQALERRDPAAQALIDPAVWAYIQRNGLYNRSG